MQRFFYVYVLVSEDNETIHYTGITQDVQARLIRHNQGLRAPTAKYRPWRIQTAIAFGSEIKARAFERYLKTGSGREFARRHFQSFRSCRPGAMTEVERARFITHRPPEFSHSLQSCGRPFGLARA
jgi:putative endonuclease